MKGSWVIMEDIEMLNSIYEPICQQCKDIQNNLKHNGYVSKKGFYNNHSIRDKSGNWITEYFPIPVITVEQLCDVGIDMKSIFIETKMKREKAIEYDFSRLLRYKFEVYGIEEYLNDFYNDILTVEDIGNRIEMSKEKEIGIGFEIEKVCINDIMQIIKELKELETYI